MVHRSFNKILLRKATENTLVDLFEAVMPKMPVHGVFFLSKCPLSDYH